MNVEYDYGIFKNWGSDPDAETKAEVFLELLEVAGSIPFFRDHGSLLLTAINNPSAPFTEEIVQLSCAVALAGYSKEASASRKALADPSWIKTILDVDDGEGDASVTYMRIESREIVTISL